jgi:uncharacterized protein
MKPTVVWIVVVCAALVLGLAGCGSTPPSRFFTLVPLAVPAPGVAAAPGEAAVSPGGLVDLEPVRIPELVDRPQFVTSVSEHERRFDEYARWAEPLAPQLTAVLAENLSALLAPQTVLVSAEREGRKPARTVRVEVRHFDLVASGEAVLVAHWSVRDTEAGADARPLAEATGTWRTPVGGTDPAAYPAAMSRNLLELSSALAAALRQPTP